jgi:hypothetical protein
MSTGMPHAAAGAGRGRILVQVLDPLGRAPARSAGSLASGARSRSLPVPGRAKFSSLPYPESASTVHSCGRMPASETWSAMRTSWPLYRPHSPSGCFTYTSVWVTFARGSSPGRCAALPGRRDFVPGLLLGPLLVAACRAIRSRRSARRASARGVTGCGLPPSTASSAPSGAAASARIFSICGSVRFAFCAALPASLGRSSSAGPATPCPPWPAAPAPG